MFKKRLWIALVAIPICMASMFVIGAERSYQVKAGGVIDPTCTSSSPCIEYDNNGSGAGVRGVSALGNGLNGQTKRNSTSSSNGTAGVIGSDASASGSFDTGVRGSSPRGTGVNGSSSTGTGVSGLSTFGAGAAFRSISNVGTFSSSGNNDGINASTTQNSSLSGHGRSGIFAHDDSTDGGHLNVGVAGSSIAGFGVEASSTEWIGANVLGGAFFTTFEVPAFSLVENANGATVLMDACSSGVSVCEPSFAEQVMELEASGDMFLKGEIHTSGSCVVGCSPTANHTEARVITYAPMISQPTREDYGEAQLASGQAYVRLDPAFANIIDHTRGYLVFLTPEGPSQGLYVTGKSIAGFFVRENPGGHATIGFQYRIVAKPYGVKAQRLPMKLYRAGPRASTVIR